MRSETTLQLKKPEDSIQVPYYPHLSLIGSVITSATRILGPFEPTVKNNAGKTNKPNLRRDVTNMTHEQIIDYFFQTGVYIHICYINENVLDNSNFFRLLEKAILKQAENKRKEIYKNIPFIKRIGITKEGTDFLFQLFENEENKLLFSSSYINFLSKNDLGKTMGIIRKEKALLEKINRATRRGPLYHLKIKLSGEWFQI